MWVRDAGDDWWRGPDLNELSCCMIGKYALNVSLNPISMGGQLIGRILYNLADVIKYILFNIIMISSDFIWKLQYLQHKINNIFFCNLSLKIILNSLILIVPFPATKHSLMYSTHTNTCQTLHLNWKKERYYQIKIIPTYIFGNHNSHKVSSLQHVPEAQTQILPPDLPYNFYHWLERGSQ